MRVKVYVEGGGDRSVTLSDCRRGFSEFAAKFLPAGCQPRFVACGSRSKAYEDFAHALEHVHADECVLLLVDSEDVVQATDPWEHLSKRDGWCRPPGSTSDQVHLMVRAMESWLVSDPAALIEFYGQGFNPSALPARTNLEDEDKSAVMKALVAATRLTRTKGEYHKTRHGFALLALIDPAAVRRRSAHADRFCQTLLVKCTAGAGR